MGRVGTSSIIASIGIAGAVIGLAFQDIIKDFSNKYENANVCIFGCSGSGKSFFTKLYIISAPFKLI